MATANQATANADPTTVTTDPCTIIDFGAIELRPSKFDATPKYTIRVLAPKGSNTEKLLLAAESAAKQERWGARPPVGYRSGVQDGDAVDGAGQRLFPDVYAGHVFVTAKSSKAPTAWVGVERRKAEPADFYSGMLAIAVVKAFAYDNQSRGVGFGLNLLWKTGPGTRIQTGGVDAEAAALSKASMVTWAGSENVTDGLI